jgi:hypothetical protein
MTKKQFFDYESSGRTGLMFPRNHFRNMSRAKSIIGFPFELEEANNLYNHPYDVYSDPETDSYIWVIGNSAHCHVREKLGRYKEGIVIHCKPKDKDELIKKISKVV